jgi:hypothetical protein
MFSIASTMVTDLILQSPEGFVGTISLDLEEVLSTLGAA